MAKSLKRYAERIRSFLIRPLLEKMVPYPFPDPSAQIHLKMLYRQMAREGANLPGIEEAGFKLYSQTDEDGILLYIFSLIGAPHKTSVEICAGNGMECNTANLILSHGWHGLLVDGNERMVNRGKDFYKQHRASYVYPPRFECGWITKDNVNEIVGRNGFQGEIDLLSIDMDGVDYWIWEALDSIDPRVVIVEYNDIIGPEKAITVPYKDDFDKTEFPMTDGLPNFCGASLAAFVKLGKKKGYRLVGCNRFGYNAFFVKDPIGEALLPEIPIEDCFKHPKVLWGMKERFPTVQDLPWVEV